MNVLVTGGAGFIGSHLAEALLARGDRVRIVDDFDDFYDPALKRRNVPKGAELVEADLCEPPRDLLDGIDAVCHLAARAGVRPSLVDPAPYARNNIVATTALLTAMQYADVQRLVYTSSSSIYGARRGQAFRETDMPAPKSPYAASKLAAERLCEASGGDVSILRLFTVYGPRQRPEMAFARFVRQLRAGEPVTLYGDGSSVRDYTYVGDAVDAIVRALDRAEGVRIANVAGGEPVRLDHVVEVLADVLGVRPRIALLPEQPGDVPETRADLTVAREWLGWAPATSLREGLARYVASLEESGFFS